MDDRVPRGGQCRQFRGSGLDDVGHQCRRLFEEFEKTCRIVHGIVLFQKILEKRLEVSFVAVEPLPLGGAFEVVGRRDEPFLAGQPERAPDQGWVDRIGGVDGDGGVEAGAAGGFRSFEALQEIAVKRIGHGGLRTDDLVEENDFLRGRRRRFEVHAVRTDRAERGNAVGKHCADRFIETRAAAGIDQRFAVFDDAVEPGDEIAVLKRGSVAAEFEVDVGVDQSRHQQRRRLGAEHLGVGEAPP